LGEQKWISRGTRGCDKLPHKSKFSAMGEPLLAYGEKRAGPETSYISNGWQRQGRLRDHQCFSWWWTRGGEPSGNINVRTEEHAVVLIYRVRSHGETEWKDIEQRVLITWTTCHLGGRRPWFVCSVYKSGRYCGRRVAVLYGEGQLFACRGCYGLAYSSQQQSPRDRNLSRAQKIRMKLGGSPSLLEPFPPRPRRMHTRTYVRLKARSQASEATSWALTKSWLDR
jgi:hypothetical protein